MTEGNIIVSGFKLDESEKAIADNLINNYRHKIAERIGFKEIKLRLKKSERGKAFFHEVQGSLTTSRTFNAKAEDFNLFSAIDEVLSKLMHEAEHFKGKIFDETRNKL